NRISCEFHRLHSSELPGRMTAGNSASRWDSCQGDERSVVPLRARTEIIEYTNELVAKIGNRKLAQFPRFILGFENDPGVSGLRTVELKLEQFRRVGYGTMTRIQLQLPYRAVPLSQLCSSAFLDGVGYSAGKVIHLPAPR
ncbi:MAG: hypothetical protein WAK20_01515, partial [Candidatus Acidiferrum sp.]